MVFVSTPNEARPKEIIERTFDVFCGLQQTMDIVGFAKFCASSKRVLASEADDIFSAVVQNAHRGMELSEFKDALTLLVDVGSKVQSHPGTERKPLSERNHRASPKAVKPARKSLAGQRKSTGQKPEGSHHCDAKSEARPIFRWSPLDIGDSIDENNDCRLQQEPLSQSRTIRWCPAELE
jgi:hypothetical protein